MKKITYGLLALAMMFTVSGCSDASTKVSNGKEQLISIGKDSITKETLYSTLLSQGQITPIINLVTEKLIELEVPMTAEIEEEARKNFDDLKEAIGENFEKLIKQAGFDTEEAYYEERVVYTVRAARLTNVYLENEFAKAATSYRPIQVQMIEVDNAEDALLALNAIKGGMSFEDAGEEYATSKNLNGVTTVINNKLGLDSGIFSKISTKTSTGLIDEVLESSNKKSYYVVSIVESEPTKFEEAATNSLAAITSVSDDAFQYFLEKYDFRIYDIDVYSAFKSQAPKFIIQD